MFEANLDQIHSSEPSPAEYSPHQSKSIRVFKLQFEKEPLPETKML